MKQTPLLIHAQKWRLFCFGQLLQANQLTFHRRKQIFPFQAVINSKQFLGWEFCIQFSVLEFVWFEPMLVLCVCVLSCFCVCVWFYIYTNHVCMENAVSLEKLPLALTIFLPPLPHRGKGFDKDITVITECSQVSHLLYIIHCEPLC